MSDISSKLILEAAKGDIRAFEEIYRLTSAFVYNVVYRITNNRNNADEVTQDVFLKVYNGLKSFEMRSSFKTWVYRIATNSAINYCRRNARYENAKVEYDPSVHEPRVPSEVRLEIEKADSEATVASILGALEPDQRACIVLREIEGLDYKAIAETLKININTVRSRLSRAREKIMKMRKDGGRDEVRRGAANVTDGSH